MFAKIENIWDRQNTQLPPKNNYPWAGSLDLCPVSSKHPVVRVVDLHAQRWGDKNVVGNLASSLKGLQTRRERYGEVIGRLRNGMWRKPQHVIDARDLAQIPQQLLSADAKHNWRLVFSDNKLNWWDKSPDAGSTVFLIIDAPQVRTYAHKPKHKPNKTRTEIPGKADPKENRKILSVCVRERTLSPQTLTELKRVTDSAGYPFFELDSLLATEK